MKLAILASPNFDFFMSRLRRCDPSIVPVYGLGSQVAGALRFLGLLRQSAVALSLERLLARSMHKKQQASILEAMLIALNTLSQFASTHATASVPSRSVLSFVSKAPI